jgi:NAD(P)-dependent dehydrogenase (short-subunit alcohol dehydrogenase family)
MSLEGRTAVVTGGAAGIGRGIATELAREGADIVVADMQAEPKVPEEEGSETTVERVEELGQNARFVETDVSDPAEAEALMQVAAEQFGGIDVLVNNAGIASSGTVETASLSTWQRTLSVNLTGAFLCSKYAMPYLRESDRARVINISSQGAFRAGSNNVSYGVSKAGISQLTRAMAVDHGEADGVNVNAICPGPIRTSMMIETLDDPEARQPYDDHTFVDFFGTPEDVGRAAVFLCSEDARYIQGHNLMVDGGWMAQ